MSSQLVQSLRPEARKAPESGIVEVVNAAREQSNLIPLWIGEGDLPTPGFIREAAKSSLDLGETFYTYQRGIPELRQALASYHEGVYGRAFQPERFFITGSGMHAIELAVQCVAGAGDEVVYPTPAWPNLAAAVEVMGAVSVPVPMDFTPEGWSLDVDRLFSKVTSRTKAIFLNSPSNPTGWVASLDVLSAILDRARALGLWIIADEVYGRFYYGAGQRAPSFYDIADENDRILYVNTFSKNWAMTGWRIGWLSAPAELGQVIENLIQYTTSGVAVFSQRGALTALTSGGEFLEEQIERAREGRRITVDGLSPHQRIRFAAPEGAFYFFFGVDGISDTRQLALDLVRETGVGLAPGSAFGAAGEGFLRLCFARRQDQLAEAVDRIGKWVSKV